MIKKVLKKLERLQNEKNKLITERANKQEEIDNIEIEIKKYMRLKTEYEKIGKKYDELVNFPEIKK